MKNKERMRNRLFCRVTATVIVLCLMFSMVISVSAATVNQAVTNAKSGVVQIQVWFSDPETAVEQYLQSGSGFLINENTIVTCQHVVTAFPDSFYVKWAQETNAKLGGNRTAAEVKEHLELRVSVYRDVYVKATVKKASTEMDYAVLTLNEDIHNRTPLKLRDSSELKQTEEVFALGFPADMVALEDAKYYDTEQVDITSGKVNKVGNMTFGTWEGGIYDSVSCVESGATITSGNSGGPLVDADGNVVGINAAMSDTRNIAISSKQLIDVLKALGITYTAAESNVSVDVPADDPTEPKTEPVTLATNRLSDLIAKAEEKNAQDYTDESYNTLKDAIKTAKSALSATTQNEIDNAVAGLENAIDSLEKQEAKSPLSKSVIIGIIAFAVILIAVVVIVLVVFGKKKSKSQTAAPVVPASAPASAPAPAVKPVAPVKPAVPATTETTVLNQGAGETTVLSQGAGETTVLSQNVNGGTLVRSNNNERIPICSAEFIVGRERRSVDYCVGGNTNISRVHARFVVRDGVTYIIDNKAANGTFVNGVKARAGQEIELKDGDKILLADEKFEYKK